MLGKGRATDSGPRWWKRRRRDLYVRKGRQLQLCNETLRQERATDLAESPRTEEDRS